MPSALRSIWVPWLLAGGLAATLGWQWTDAGRLADAVTARQTLLRKDSAAFASARTAERLVDDSLGDVLRRRAARDSVARRAYLVVSIADNRLWLRRDDEVVFETRVATGSGRHLEREGGEEWRFETPRGRLVVQRKDIDPAWVPPDWHYVEVAERRGLELVRLSRSRTVPAAGGSVVKVSGDNVVTRYPDGRETPFEVREGGEIVVGQSLIVPPLGTRQRRYSGVLGSHRLYLGGGYGIHGTDVPSSIGRSVSHGCIRLRNEDIESLFRLVSVGTPVYIY